MIGRDTRDKRWETAVPQGISVEFCSNQMVHRSGRSDLPWSSMGWLVWRGDIDCPAALRFHGLIQSSGLMFFFIFWVLELLKMFGFRYFYSCEVYMILLR